MAITKTTGYKASDGQVYATVEEAQTKEIAALFEEIDKREDLGNPSCWSPDEIATSIVRTLKDNLLDILTTGPRSRPSTRKKAGTTAPRRARARATTATEVGERFKAMHEAVDVPQEPETALETGR